MAAYERTTLVFFGRESVLDLTRSAVYSWNIAAVRVAAPPMPAASIVSEMPIRVPPLCDAIFAAQPVRLCDELHGAKHRAPPRLT